MYLLAKAALPLIGLVAASVTPAFAARTGEISCGIGMPAGFTYADQPVTVPLAYPRSAENSWSEGWVALELVVTPQGDVRDVFVVDAMGPKEFVAVSVKAIGRYRYRPATRGGTPTTQHLLPFHVTYRFSDSKSEADHPEFVDAFKRARRQLVDGRADQAINTLDGVFRSKLNLYEASLGSYLLALAHAQKEDWDSARFHAEHAVFDTSYLDNATKTAAWELAAKLRARVGDLVGAMCALKQLPAASRSGFASLEAEMQARLQSDAPLVSDAKIMKHALTDQPGLWRRKLVRPKFSFANVNGEVKSFRLACVAATLDALVDPEMQWTIPDQAGSCYIRVTGTPGATFKLVEDW